VVKQTKLFPEAQTQVLKALELETAEKVANQVKIRIDGYCEKIELVGSIRRKKATVHDIDFVILTTTDNEWRRIVEELKRMKARTICAGNNLVKMLVPNEKNYFQVDFYRAKTSTFGIHTLIRTGSAEHNM
jgi:DNA polymerase/3'-5' exonuclease PolX